MNLQKSCTHSILCREYFKFEFYVQHLKRFKQKKIKQGAFRTSCLMRDFYFPWIWPISFSSLKSHCFSNDIKYFLSPNFLGCAEVITNLLFFGNLVSWLTLRRKSFKQCYRYYCGNWNIKYRQQASHKSTYDRSLFKSLNINTETKWSSCFETIPY